MLSTTCDTSIATFLLVYNSLDTLEKPELRLIPWAVWLSMSFWDGVSLVLRDLSFRVASYVVTRMMSCKIGSRLIEGNL